MNYKDDMTKVLLELAGVFLLVLGMIIGYTLNKSDMSEHITNLEADRQLVYDQMLEYESELTTVKKYLSSEKEENEFLKSENETMREELLSATNTIMELKSEEYELVYLGDYNITHYCVEKRAHICGTGAGITATGTQVTAGRTIAVDPRVIPYGSEVYIEGYGWRVAEDCGGAVKNKHIDVAVETHSKAISMGTTTGGVWVLVKRGS